MAQLDWDPAEHVQNAAYNPLCIVANSNLRVLHAAEHMLHGTALA